eukprot:TRINITY_DN2064_c0_g1_i2.p2 TRINITY_DN2064_c0_g1~~TRINITY_DN2064_c0_g1_i2.p2  ORF type:complete len:200 (+),score=23.35 TRINITY_DN2064_c0_g1_i2:128-727(+)
MATALSLEQLPNEVLDKILAFSRTQDAVRLSLASFGFLNRVRQLVRSLDLRWATHITSSTLSMLLDQFQAVRTIDVRGTAATLPEFNLDQGRLAVISISSSCNVVVAVRLPDDLQILTVDGRGRLPTFQFSSECHLVRLCLCGPVRVESFDQLRFVEQLPQLRHLELSIEIPDGGLHQTGLLRLPALETFFRAPRSRYS